MATTLRQFLCTLSAVLFHLPSCVCGSVFQELGVHGSFTKIDEFSLEMIPFDSDLLSMEMERSFRVCPVLFLVKCQLHCY